MISFRSRGSFKNLDRFLKTMGKKDIFARLDEYGKDGVNALRASTPVDSGYTASSWSFETGKSRGFYTIAWTNTHVNSGVPIAIILQYGHGTGTGGYVAGRDYINPAIKPIFDKIADGVWKAVTLA